MGAIVACVSFYARWFIASKGCGASCNGINKIIGVEITLPVVCSKYNLIEVDVNMFIKKEFRLDNFRGSFIRKVCLLYTSDAADE